MLPNKQAEPARTMLPGAQSPARPTNEVVCRPGVTRLFGDADIGVQGLLSGWAGPEEGHTWTDGPEAMFALAVETASAGDIPPLSLELVGQPYLPRRRPVQELTIYANGFCVGYRRLTAHAETHLTLPLLPQWWFGNGARVTLLLCFHLPHCARPKDLGDGEDSRELGFSFQSVCLR